MADIIFYNNNSDRRCINKVLADAKTISGNVKTQYTSSGISLDIDVSVAGITPFQFNYMKFDNKYYYIDSVDFLSQNIIRLNCSIDLLESYKSQILNQTAVLNRSETSYNRYLTDDNLHINAYKRVQTKAFGNSFSAVSTPILIVTGG